MPAVIIPFSGGNGNYEFSTTIQGVEYIFVVQWNTRCDVYGNKKGAWYFDVLDVNRRLIARNIKIVLGCYLGKPSNDPLFTQGAMMVVDTTFKGIEATFDDLGSRVLVEYVPDLELIQRWKEFG